MDEREMEAQIGKEEAGEKTTRKCISCGYQDTGEYCSNCGSRLEFLGDERVSSIQNFRIILGEYLREVLDPIFAYIKTIWLLLFQPVKFFQVLCFREQPISEIHFPLGSLWRKVSGKRTQYTLHPIAFYTSNFVINIISGALVLIVLLMVSRGDSYEPNNASLIPSVSSAGFFTLLYMLATAFIFDFLTKESKVSPLFKYSFWVYIFSLVWIGPLLGACILIVLLLPLTCIFGCVLVIILGLIQVALSPDSTTFAEPYTTVLSTYSSVSTVLNILFSGIGGIYLFLVIPWRVFSNIFQKEELPTKNLWVIILASLIIPAIPLFLCASPLLVPR